jgi:peptidoglycan/xylan/chitin deacetylase (PgdA/CDA1 family)
MAGLGHAARRALLITATVAAVALVVLVWRGRGHDRPAEDSPGYHLDPTELAAQDMPPVGPGVRVLCYHYFRADIDPGYLARVLGAVLLGMPSLGPQEFWTTPIGQFERHLRYFRDHDIPVLTLDDIADRQRRGEPLPDPAVVITIDDADRSVHDLAWPLMQRYGVRGHLFVPTSRVGGPWSGIDVCTWEELREMADSGTIILGSHTHDLHYKVGTDQGRQPVFWNPDRIDVEARLDVRLGLRGLEEQVDDDAQTAPGVVTDPVGADLLLSRQLIEREGRRPCRWLAWPYGFGNEALDRLAAGAGFDGTLSLRPRSMDDNAAPWHIGRYTLTAKTTPDEIAALLRPGEEP